MRLSGFPPDQLAVIEATLPINRNGVRRSEILVRTDADGMVDLATTAPISGTYTITDGQGLFWSMQWVEIRNPDEPRRFDPLANHEISVNARTVPITATDVVSVSTRLQRVAVPEQVRVEEMYVNELPARFYQPDAFDDARPGSVPAVLVLGGSGGGFLDVESALLASHGFAALAVSYVPVGGATRIPIDSFDEVITFLSEHPRIDPARLYVMGTSLGATLALLLAANYPEIDGVVALHASHIVWNDAGDEPRFTLAGQPLPFVPFTLPMDVRVKRYQGAPVEYVSAYLPYLDDPTKQDTIALERATIDLASINGPILFVSGRDDRVLPAERLVQMAVEQLEKAEFAYPICHYSYADAGHFSIIPNTPVILTAPETGAGGTYVEFGGTQGGTAAAARDAWAQVLTFLWTATCTEN